MARTKNQNGKNMGCLNKVWLTVVHEHIWTWQRNKRSAWYHLTPPWTTTEPSISLLPLSIFHDAFKSHIVYLSLATSCCSIVGRSQDRRPSPRRCIDKHGQLLWSGMALGNNDGQQKPQTSSGWLLCGAATWAKGAEPFTDADVV